MEKVRKHFTGLAVALVSLKFTATSKRRHGTCTGSTIETLESEERVMAKKKEQDSGFQDEGEGGRVVELKVSSDGGVTWFRRKINMGVEDQRTQYDHRYPGGHCQYIV